MYYILEDNEIKKAEVEVWSKWMDETDRTLLLDEHDNVIVSTVFLGVNHGTPDDVILFETMVFNGYYNGFQQRYKTLQQALSGHKEVVKMIGLRLSKE